ncbi:MAG: type II toxin-antitoxin system PemK/MazF family toxin [ANME-2 cluster archaeon]|jgi:mRNA interferase MazF|nr:type II toxin-antitoxin system PemK/MazF family toxin [ANME-2 cluster archaeon]
MREGDIYLVEIPSSGGHEQAGQRPAIIVQVSSLERLPTVLIVPLTSKLRAADFPFTFIIEPDNLNNLNVVSVALVFQLRAIDKRRMKNKIGKIEQIKLELLKQRLKEIMGLK